jgi:hypothetical protein
MEQKKSVPQLQPTAPKQQRPSSPMPAGTGSDSSERGPVDTGRRQFVTAGLLAGAFVLGVATGQTFPLWRQAPGPTIAADQPLSQEQVERLRQGFLATQTRGISTPTVTGDQRRDAIQRLDLPAAQRQQLVQTLEKPDNQCGVRFVSIQLWDNMAIDGDVVSASACGYTVEVRLGATPTIYEIPLEADNTIALNGVRDGGGGITVGLNVGGQSIPYPPMTTGEIRRIKFDPQ